MSSSCNVNSNDKSYSSSYSKVFSKSIARDAKFSSFKTEDPLPLEDGVLSDEPVDSSCICKSNYDVVTYREEAPHLSYGEKVDLIKNGFFMKKKLSLSRNNKLFWIWVDTTIFLALSFCKWRCIFLLVLWFLLGHGFSTRASRVKNLFSQPFWEWPSAVSYFRAHCEGKKKKIDPSHESVQSLHFSIWPNLETIFSHIKGSSHEINLSCDRKYKYEVQEDRKVLAPIADTVVTLGRLGLLFRGTCDDWKYYLKVGE